MKTNKQNRQIYIARGKCPRDWSETDLMGPFKSEALTVEAIRKDVENSVEATDMLSQGYSDDWCEQYHLWEHIKSFQPALNVSVDVSLRRVAAPHP